ncbi:MAG TPA: hypothetical protein VFV86_10220 [Nitrososphaeraceae archaeon]|nr:hypothetical protein [Nitrososphaeraceae archaeon]
MLQVEEQVPKVWNRSRKPHNIHLEKVTKEIEEEILYLRTTKRFGWSRIKFRLKRLKETTLTTKTIHN